MFTLLVHLSVSDVRSWIKLTLDIYCSKYINVYVAEKKNIIGLILISFSTATLPRK